MHQSAIEPIAVPSCVLKDSCSELDGTPPADESWMCTVLGRHAAYMPYSGRYVSQIEDTTNEASYVLLPCSYNYNFINEKSAMCSMTQSACEQLSHIIIIYTHDQSILYKLLKMCLFETAYTSANNLNPNHLMYTYMDCIHTTHLYLLKHIPVL